MKEIEIFLKGNNDEFVLLFLDDKEIGVINNKLTIELPNKSHNIYVKYGDKKSNTLKLVNVPKGDYFLEIDKTSKVIFTDPLRLLRIVFFMFLSSFCFHKAFGVGYIVFGVYILLTVITVFVNWNKLFVRKIKR